VAPGNVTGLAAADLGNGAQDLVAANNSTGTVSVLLNDGSGNFTRTDYTLGGTPRNAFRVVLADVNGDGNLDVVTDNVTSAGNPGFIYILYGNGDGTFAPAQIVNSGGNRPSGVAVADVEGDVGNDGLSDIIVSNNGSNNVTVLTHTLAPVVVSTTLTGTPIPPVDQGQIVFSDPIDPSTFTPDQFVLLDPSGNRVNVHSIDAQDSSNTRFNITFDPQSALGTYTLTVGPDIMDRTDTYTAPVFHTQFRLLSFSEVPIPTPNSQPIQITAGPDGNLWFTESGLGRIGHITTGGAITELALPNSSSRPVGITSGPDGNLWFAEQNARQIGRLTPDGSLTEFAIPTANSQPTGITAGPDGNLWFAEFQGNKIGRITPDGAITEFAVPTSGSGPVFITPGPDGNLWFTEFNSAKIGRITPGGTITEFPVPTLGSEPEGIAAGADGNVWFTEWSADKIGRITPDGSVTEFSLPNGSGLSEVIAAGGDGNLWFTDPQSNQIGQITPAGSVTDFQIPTPSSNPQGITAGPDGSIWFTEYNVNQIGRFIGGGPHPAPGPGPRGARTGAVVIPADLLRANPAALNPSPGPASLPREPLAMGPRISGEASPLGSLLSSSPMPTSEAAASPPLGSRVAPTNAVVSRDDLFARWDGGSLPDACVGDPSLAWMV
jgi:streptogramin lyase